MELRSQTIMNKGCESTNMYSLRQKNKGRLDREPGSDVRKAKQRKAGLPKFEFGFTRLRHPREETA